MIPPRDPHRVNRRRGSSLTLPDSGLKMRTFIGAALVGALVFHLVLGLLCYFFNINLNISSTLADVIVPDQILVNPKEEEDTPEVVEIPPEKIITEDDPAPPDIIDVPLEQLVVAPGETVITSDTGLDTPKPDDIPIPEQTDPAKLLAGLPEVTTDSAFVNDNTVVIKAPPVDVDINLDALKNDLPNPDGVGGNDASLNPDGSKSLQQLLNAPSGSLGQGSGFSRLGADLLFEYDKHTLKSTAHVGLLQLAALVEKNKSTRFIIEGHTDSFGNPAYNKKLSLLRANAIRKWLAGNDIDLSRIFIRACGSDTPVVPVSGDKAAQAANRRVEIHMRKDNEPLPEGCINATEELPEYSAPLTPKTASSTPSKTNPAPTAQAQPKPIAQSPSTPKPTPAKPSAKPGPSGAEIIEEPTPPKPAPAGAEIIEEPSPAAAEIIDA